MLALIDPRVWIAFIVAVAVSFSGGVLVGYGYHAVKTEHKADIVEAVQTTTQAITTTTVQAKDTKTIARLQARIKAATDKATALEALINEERNNSPIPPADCALPERVRDEINRSLTADTE